MTTSEINIAAETLYEYGQLHQVLKQADAIVALGNKDLRIASRAAEIWHNRLAPVVVASGGVGRLTPPEWEKSEAAMFAQMLYDADVPRANVLVEDQSTNLPQNIAFSIDILKKNNFSTNRLILTCLPFAQRRVLALCRKQFPENKFQVTSQTTPYSRYPNSAINRTETISLIVGELDRLIKFPAAGFSVAEPVPQNIKDSVGQLLRAGYDKYEFKRP